MKGGGGGVECQWEGVKGYDMEDGGRRSETGAKLVLKVFN